MGLTAECTQQKTGLVLEDRPIEKIQAESKKNAQTKQTKEHKKHVIEVPDIKGNGAEAIFDEIMAENFPKPLTSINPQIHKTQQTHYGITKQNRTHLRIS